jgi:catechol 2,3-dioxygenase-like lactoylglutathione lyase family enzyme
VSVLEQHSIIGFKERYAPQNNRFGLTRCDHFGVPTPDPDRAGKFYEAILGGVELFRAGFSPEERATGRMRHIFYHIGATLIEVVEQDDGVSYPNVTNAESRNMNPHWAWEASPEKVAAFAEHLKREGIPHEFRRHKGATAVSVYFRDQDGNNLEVTTWDDVPESVLPLTPPGPKSKGFVKWANLAHNWQPH